MARRRGFYLFDEHATDNLCDKGSAGSERQQVGRRCEQVSGAGRMDCSTWHPFRRRAGGGGREQADGLSALCGGEMTSPLERFRAVLEPVPERPTGQEMFDA